MSRYEMKLKDKFDDEIKLAGLESLVPEELEKHLILDSNLLRTFEETRLEVVSYVEAKFGLRVCDSKPVRVDTQIPWMLMRSILSRLARGKVIKSTRWVFLVRWCTFSTRLQCTQRHRQAIAWQRQTEQAIVQE